MILTAVVDAGSDDAGDAGAVTARVHHARAAPVDSVRVGGQVGAGDHRAGKVFMGCEHARVDDGHGDTRAAGRGPRSLEGGLVERPLLIPHRIAELGNRLIIFGTEHLGLGAAELHVHTGDRRP
jgi:hypothetical protein